MKRNIDSFDLISSIIQKRKDEENFEIKFKQINNLRNLFHNENLKYDLGYYDFTELSNEFPHNVIMEQTTIKIYVDDDFIKIMKRGGERITMSSDYENLFNKWFEEL